MKNNNKMSIIDILISIFSSVIVLGVVIYNVIKFANNGNTLLMILFLVIGVPITMLFVVFSIKKLVLEFKNKNNKTSLKKIDIVKIITFIVLFLLLFFILFCYFMEKINIPISNVIIKIISFILIFILIINLIILFISNIISNFKK